MTYNRQRLPVTRMGLTHKQKIGDDEIYITVNLFPDTGEVGEIFVKAENKSDLKGWCNIMSELMSVCLQAGVPLEVVCRHIGRHRFGSSGPTDLGIVSSVSEYLARWLRKQFLKEEDPVPEPPVLIPDSEVKVPKARWRGRGR